MPLSTLVILPFLILTITFASLFQQKKWQLLIIVLMTVFIVMELTSVYFSGGFINYQFFVNLNVNDIIEGLFIFKLQAVLVIAVFFGLVFILSKLANLYKRKCRLFIRLLFAGFAIISISYPNGPLSRLYEIYQVTSAPHKPFQQALQSLNMIDYPTKDQIVSQKGKNIIVLSLESFEQGFLDFEEITPNLRQLRQDYTFFANMPMSTGSSWTTASMYTYMTGMPFLIGGYTTSPLMKANQTQLVSLGDVLRQAGYQTRYVMAGPNFAGIGHTAGLFGMQIVSEETYVGQYPNAPFGLYDKDILDIAQKQIIEMNSSGKPFALFISTVSTHAPNGFNDERMQSVISPKDDNMSFVAASLDYNVGQFIRYLKDNGLLDNTVFYIFPDHLMMGAGTATINRLSQKERKLYLLTNAKTKNLHKTPDQVIYQIDLPRLILNGAQVKSNAKFLTDYLTEPNLNKKQFIEQYKSKIATINNSAQVFK
ncbi:LTA synthase family protein [Gilliamella sp. B2776]|uniref:LTA synthase family protein n=1 Tax=unclassified Gilliamella TaxID=2685620 RepID=UPI00226A6631|nr:MULTISPECIES: LTA synthase family protein [unclassified Gilliamella]MCX8649309.1 LTA synthase family protein [Gilliamella sp. B2779]MCX8655077.1 LTA synthase family protein [Gilliamella sp. B2737]MCX8655849.1 LTA synthase family protein [Gilliamella sp. B2894]MCX8691196.1 LTA synthase family protein [Gilliamella sp. B2776]MCX8694606.1 LTA synthase family protein [Gilliamella sp. B2881]